MPAATADRGQWLPPGKRAAVCLSVDDVHPASDGRGRDRARAALDHVRWLQARHPRLKVTLFTTPDRRSITPFPTRRTLTRIPVVGRWIYGAPVLPRGTNRLDRRPEFCRYLRDWDRTEIAIHGLHHVSRGREPIVEFAGKSVAHCRGTLRSAVEIFSDAGLPLTMGVAPPGWTAPAPLLRAMTELEMRFIASARDLVTPVTAAARTAGSGLQGVSLIYPERIADTPLIHFTTNYQATSSPARARAILEHGGLLGIKAHLLDTDDAGTHTALDGLTAGYRDQLHDLLSALDADLGDALWWTSMGEIADRMRGDKKSR
jgi:hypothetical protein